MALQHFQKISNLLEMYRPIDTTVDCLHVLKLSVSLVTHWDIHMWQEVRSLHCAAVGIPSERRKYRKCGISCPMPTRMKESTGEMSSYLDMLRSYEPENDSSNRVSFKRILSLYPAAEEAMSKSGISNVHHTRVSDFSGIGYCAYKSWHYGRRTPQIRPPRIAKLVATGTHMHSVREMEILQESTKRPQATAAQLKNPKVDIFDIPEFPTTFLEGDVVYHAKVDSASRISGDLRITELKTGNFVGMPDHYLQMWAYCLATPSGLCLATNHNFRAQDIQWQIRNPRVGKGIGPFPFTENMLKLVRMGMYYHNNLYKMGLSGVTKVPLETTTVPTATKCSACAFSHSCMWRASSEEDEDEAIHGRVN